MRSDVPVGALLLGGLDSVCIVTEVCGQLKARGEELNGFRTFTACYENARENDEREFAHLVNEHGGAKETFVFPQVAEIEKEYEHAVWHYDGMCYFSQLGVMETIMEVSKSGIKVCLNGQGGDESILTLQN